MNKNDIINRCIEHKHALIFVGGMATAVVGMKILKSAKTKELASKSMAKVLSCKSEIEESIQDIKDNAEDIRTDATAEKTEAVVVDTTKE